MRVSVLKTKTFESQSQLSRPRLKMDLKAKIETDTETKSKHKEELLNIQVKIVSCFTEITLNENLSSQDRDFGKSVLAFETESLRDQCQFRDWDWETPDGQD